MAKVKPEDIQSVIFYDWIRYVKLDHVCHHVANERQCSDYEGNLLKRKGVKAGVLDYDLKIARKGYHGLLIELKIKPNKLSKFQEQYIKDVTKEGYLAVTCWSAEEAKQVVIDYLNLSEQPPAESQTTSIISA